MPHYSLSVTFLTLALLRTAYTGPCLYKCAFGRWSTSTFIDHRRAMRSFSSAKMGCNDRLYIFQKVNNFKNKLKIIVQTTNVERAIEIGSICFMS